MARQSSRRKLEKEFHQAHQKPLQAGKEFKRHRGDEKITVKFARPVPHRGARCLRSAMEHGTRQEIVDAAVQISREMNCHVEFEFNGGEYIGDGYYS